MQPERHSTHSTGNMPKLRVRPGVQRWCALRAAGSCLQALAWAWKLDDACKLTWQRSLPMHAMPCHAGGGHGFCRRPAVEPWLRRCGCYQYLLCACVREFSRG